MLFYVCGSKKVLTLEGINSSSCYIFWSCNETSFYAFPSYSFKDLVESDVYCDSLKTGWRFSPLPFVIFLRVAGGYKVVFKDC